jgi:ribonuclease D
MRRASRQAASRPVSPARFVDTEEDLSELVDELCSAEAFAIDTEFHRERTYYPHLALVQVGWDGKIALIDPLAVDVAPLATVFRSGALAVLHAADQDLEVLERACGSVPEEIFDTQLCAGFIGYPSPSLVSLVESVLQHRLHKGDQLTDWTRRPLSAEQLTYAAGDVAYLLELRDCIAARMDALGRTEWAAQECALLLHKDRSDVEPEESWWRLHHSRQLRPGARAVAQEVVAWRERRARRLDLPVRFVLSDMAVLSLAQRPPRNREELVRSRGVDPRHVGGSTADEVLAAVKRGQSLPASELRLPPPQPFERQNRPVIALASAYVGQRAAELSLDPAILATRADLMAFFQPVPSGRLAAGWRCELIGKMLQRLVDGEAALAFDGGDGLVLEERSRKVLEPDLDD